MSSPPSDDLNAKSLCHLLILGVLLASCCPHVQVSSASCKSKNISGKYQHCGTRAGGVHGLDCYRKYKQRAFTCTWKPGEHTSRSNYTLVLQQRDKNYCRIYNVSESRREIKPFSAIIMTVEVFENAASANCTKATFRGLPENLVRCGPPKTASFWRHSGGLCVNVSWHDEEKFLSRFHVSYKELDEPQRNQSSVKSEVGKNCTVENLNTSLAYVIQIRCDTNEKCTQCPWSENYMVLPELVRQPVIVDFRDTDVPEKRGRRLVSVIWKFPAKELHDGYKVAVGKSSGETQTSLNTSLPEIRLILSSSAYQINISAFNNVSNSPAVSYTIPERENVTGSGDGRLNVTVHNSTSFIIHWRSHVSMKYVCYSVEWKKKASRAWHKSFYQQTNSYRFISPLPEPLEPYQRYSITLHLRPNKDTCNMKNINNSESTYGRTHFYYTEGSPVSAPTNISSCDVQFNSALLRWSSIPEDDVRGFLLGYIIHYTTYQHKGTSKEKTVTVSPLVNSYKLNHLKSGTAYQVQISGFTSAGTGVKSTTSFFKTPKEGTFNLRSFIVVCAVVIFVLIFGTPIIKRTKTILWPSIPDPGCSSAVQKMDGPCQVGLLASMTTLKVEEWYTKSLQILNKDEVTPSRPLTPTLPLISTTEFAGDSLQLTCDWIQSDGATGDIFPDDSTETSLETQQPDLQGNTLAFASGYTTMEMFQQLMPQAVSATTDAEDPPVATPTVDYVRQFSTSPTSDSEHMSTIF